MVTKETLEQMNHLAIIAKLKTKLQRQEQAVAETRQHINAMEQMAQLANSHPTKK